MSPHLYTGGGAASLAVLVASLALGKSALESIAYTFMVLTFETGACLTRFPGMKRELPIFWMALSVLCIPIFLGKRSRGVISKWARVFRH